MESGKLKGIRALATKDGVISALAIDQRGSLKKMIGAASGHEATKKEIEDFKVAISSELTPYASGILLDPEFGIPAAKARDKDAGLLMAYEKTGYDATEPGRFPDILEDWSVSRLKELGADAIKFLLYYDVDESSEINEKKHAFIERLGDECKAEDMPLFLELVSYDANIPDANGKEYAKVKPHKVIEMVREFSKSQYGVDVLKVEVPVNQKYVEGFAENSDNVVYSRTDALEFYKEESDATKLPFIFLSAGVSAELFQEELLFAKEAGSTFNGVLCGRATWRHSVEPFAGESEEAGRKWMQTEGRKNIEDLNKVLAETASSVFDKIEEAKINL
ncbi:tagatose-bisphosphate aldolase [Pediococcus claussenii]|uniref:Tagatose 1,6-diphosphate aldolase n=1 Tax=Pediococcus claussenii (strain ATCC BAA-344 / DSM 14800 / JCM 18046 / KCTC 3811 / LMG 21948 / P06) TaxID=701521 RepID=G8PEB7_PEDCP|nr:tagatose-bisphosphate aldolase [Pediococcus claussenii]AEV94378.1 tagatose 1,6-diphosphate aldolase [Pediococcus claussenii ATCC BAA-344]ANZ69599.1 tagatose-bisphosphate aldolase [Pediococcus claussenii]ANZ71416.1 tagatose-bisphosphate aldolase [Pediococcus claussenii]KRN19360.1 lacD protein [Pediococcus claussenii]